MGIRKSVGRLYIMLAPALGVMLTQCEIQPSPDDPTTENSNGDPTGGISQNAPTPVPVDPVTSIEDPRLYDPALGLTEAQIAALFEESSCDALNPDEAFEPIYTDGDLTGAPPDFRRGLRGRVTVPPAGFNSNSFRNLNNYIPSNGATRLDNTLFFASLNVPTRPFSSGFPLLGGGMLQNASGGDLFEWFRVDFDGFLELQANNPEGEYEFAILADDGARLKMGLEMATIIDFPDVTATRMMCAESLVSMYRGYVQPFEVAYFQGPKYHIALTLLWRLKSETPEPHCGTSGNGRFFDSTQTPPVPQQAFHDLEARGWQIVKPENFRIPDSELFNPCLSERVRSVLGWD